MASDDDTRGMQILRRGHIPDVRPETLMLNRFPVEFRRDYYALVENALGEWPPIPGYETQHHLLIERMCYAWMLMKMDDNKIEADINWKTYRIQFSLFIKSCEALLKQAKNITLESSFQNKLVNAIIEILDRRVLDPVLKTEIIKDLNNIEVR